MKVKNYRLWAFTRLVVAIYHIVIIGACVWLLFSWLLPHKHSGLTGWVGYYGTGTFLAVVGLVHVWKVINENRIAIRQFFRFVARQVNRVIDNASTLDSEK